MKKRKGKKDIFYRYLLTYFAVLFVPLVICSVYCVRMLYIIGRDDVQSYEADLKHSAVLVENMLDGIYDMGNMLAVNPEVQVFQYKKDVFEYPNSYGINELQNALPETYEINQSVFGYFFFFNQSEMVINASMAYHYEDFYNLYLREEKYENYQSWYEEIKNSTPVYGLRPSESYIFEGEKKVNLLVYTQPLQDISDNSALRIYFRDTVLEQQLPLLPDGGIQYIMNKQGEILYSKSEKEVDYSDLTEQLEHIDWKKKGMQERTVDVQGEKYFAVQYQSEESGLTFYFLQPDSVVNSRRMSNAILLMLLVLLAATAGIAVSYWMTKKTAAPISAILKEVSRVAGETKENLPPFTALQVTFKELCRTNSTLREAMERQKPLIQNAFLNRLIYGDITSEEEAEQIAESLKLETGDKVFAILMFRFELGEDFLFNQNKELMGVCAISLTEALEKVLPKSLYANLGEDQVVLLFEMPRERVDSLRGEADRIVAELRKELPPDTAEKLAVYGGSVSEGLTGLRESYQNAVFLTWNHNEQPEGEIIWYNGTDLEAPAYPPADFGGRLTYCVVSGDAKGLHDELEKILRQYIFENSLPPYLQQMLLNELQTVLFRTLSRVRMEEAVYKEYCCALEKSHAVPLLEQFSITLGLFRELCEYVGKQKQSQGSDTLIASVVSYLDNNYMDSNLSLAGVADHFHMGESTLSSMFKQHMGINFSVYVENIRLEKAKILLRTTELSVGEIAQRVGYSSANSFCRAFKRVTGKNASAYREN